MYKKLLISLFFSSQTDCTFAYTKTGNFNQNKKTQYKITTQKYFNLKVKVFLTKSDITVYFINDCNLLNTACICEASTLPCGLYGTLRAVIAP